MHILFQTCIFIVLFYTLSISADNCMLMVPDNPLTPQGLATPYQLVGAGCNQATLIMSRFVHAVILNTDNGQVTQYNPLVINAGTTPVVAPVPVSFNTLNHVVGIWIGSNSNTLTLVQSVGVINGKCTTGASLNSPFGQFGFCNVDAFWKAMETVRVQGNLPVPPTGVASDGLPCPTIRDYFVVDMDPDDGVPTQYLVDVNGNVLQKTLNNMKLNIQGELSNDGDHRLVSAFVQGAAACQGWLIADLADPGVKRPALPMNVLQAVNFQPMPIESLPNNDPMTTTNNLPDIAKLNAYRRGIYQPQINNLQEADPAVFCRFYVNITAPRMRGLAAQLKLAVSPATPTQTLFDFMKMRASTTYAAIGCANLINVPDPFVGLMATQNLMGPMEKKFELVKEEPFDIEEYRNGGWSDGLKYRSYRYGTYYQELNRYKI
jgi:hypothetical protein